MRLLATKQVSAYQPHVEARIDQSDSNLDVFSRAGDVVGGDEKSSLGLKQRLDAIIQW